MAENAMIYVRSLHDPAATDVTHAGGKGATLARLLQAGLPVPPGCVVSPVALIAFLHAQQLAPTDSPEAIQPALQTGVVPQALQEAVHHAILELGPAPHGWAVRSSAVAEDSASASFAGVYESDLNVSPEDLWASIRACWASWWSDRALVYRQQRNINATLPAMAVVIQPMIAAHCAGVAFTAEPVSGDHTRMVIDAALGLGTTVVAGVVEPEHYTLTKTPQLALQETRLLRPDGPPVLPTEVVYTLGGLLLRLEALCERPQDVEWAWDGAQCWILQSRPITTIVTQEAGKSQDIWGNANLKDVIPGLISPFTWSLMQPQLETAMRAQYAQLHYILDPDRPLIRRFWGRGYFNLSLFFEAGAALFGATAEDQAAQLGGALAPHAMPAVAPTLRQRLYWLGNMLRFASLANRARREAPARFAALQQQWQADVQRIPHLDRAALLEHIAGYRTTAEPGLLLHLNLTWAMSGNFSYLRKMLRALLPTTEAGLVADLVTGLGDVSSADHGYQLWTLSRLARQSQQVMAFLEHKAWDTWREALAGTPFLEAWQRFLAAFGHRALYEIEMANPRWREQPAYLFEVLAAYARLPQDAAPFAPAAQARRRQAAERDVLRRLAPWRRFGFRLLLRRTQEFSRLRENSKSHLVQQIDLGRLMALRAGQLLVDDGALATPEVVFFLEHHEIIAALQGELSPEVARRLVTQRQLGRQREAARQPPELIIGERPVYGETLAAQGPQLSGLPSNPGRVTGIARVLRSPHEGARLQPGEILVAPSTDPGWTPLFLLAAGLIMETGGYLSHGAIVAREYGIPAVLNVPMATQRIPDGSTITLDGGQGVVQLLG